MSLGIEGYQQVNSRMTAGLVFLALEDGCHWTQLQFCSLVGFHSKVQPIWRTYHGPATLVALFHLWLSFLQPKHLVSLPRVGYLLGHLRRRELASRHMATTGLHSGSSLPSIPLPVCSTNSPSCSPSTNSFSCTPSTRLAYQESSVISRKKEG